MTDNQRTLNQIYEMLSRELESDLNSMSEIVKFSVKPSYNYQEPSKSLSVISGVMNFATNNVAPVKNLEAYTLPAIVSFYCVKEYANEVMAILTKYIADNKGIVQQVGDYFTIPTYSTPSQGEVQMVGQLGESIKITMYIEYAVYQGLIFTNDLDIAIDGNTVLFNEFGISKQKACDSDSVENNQTLQSIPLSQSLTFSVNAFVTPQTTFLIEECLSLENLTTTHTLTLTFKDKIYSYTVVLSDSQVNGVVGGAIYGSFTFSIADGNTGGKQ
ncbi:MAG: hypothetical protein OSJ74_00090 [Clostridia bacterium]|nr:hypothetical protein [Clostridia bacterium]